MKSWEFENLKFEVDESEFRIFAESFGARTSLAGRNRSLALSDISSINFKPAGASTLGKLDFSDKYGVTKILFKKKSAVQAQEIYEALSEVCPSAVGQPSAKKMWTSQGVEILNNSAAKKGLSVEELSDKAKVRAANVELKEAKAKEDAEKKQARQKQKAEEKALELEKYGRKVYGALIQDSILLRRVSIYEKGYAKIGSNFEKLVKATGQTYVNKKTGIGRSVGTLATFATPFPGINLFTPGNRGRISLTLVTDKKTHNFSTDQVHNSAVKEYESLLAAARSVIDEARPSTSRKTENSSRPADLPSQLKSLAELRDQGALTEEEFTEAKSKILKTGLLEHYLDNL